MESIESSDVRFIVDRIVATLQGPLEYWQFITCSHLVEALGPKAASTIPLLTGHMTHQAVAWRRAAIRALGSIGPAAAIALSQLNNATQDPDESVRQAARDAMKQIRIEETS